MVGTLTEQQALALGYTKTTNKSENTNNNKTIEYGNDFRRVQERVRKDSQGTSRIGRDLTGDDRQRLARVIGSQLKSFNGSLWGTSRSLVSKKGQTFNIHLEVNPQLFHDVFEIIRHYTDNGELVDLHDDYSNCKCYLNEDGTCGFAIEPDGNLVSVFNLGIQKSFLSTIKDMVLAEGATHLDAYAIKNQNLREMYGYAFGAKVASTMDYNMEYDHDDIAKNHGNPQVVFMVMGKAAEGEVKEKHFNKDQYDEAQSYQKSLVSNENTNRSNNNDRPYEDLKFQLISKIFDGTLTEQQALALGYTKTTNKSENTNNNKTIEYGHDFRRVQERVRKGSSSTHKGSTGSQEDISRDSRQRLAELLKRELGSQSSFSNGAVQSLTSTNKRGETNTFSLHTNVSPQLFHDVFEIIRHYTPNGELVDLHDDYSNCKCYLNEDGTCGFAIEPDGNLVSVFNLGTQKGFLWAIKDYAIQEGATHLDAYASKNQNLKEKEKERGTAVYFYRRYYSKSSFPSKCATGKGSKYNGLVYVSEEGAVGRNFCAM